MTQQIVEVLSLTVKYNTIIYPPVFVFVYVYYAQPSFLITDTCQMPGNNDLVLIAKEGWKLRGGRFVAPATSRSYL